MCMPLAHGRILIGLSRCVRKWLARRAVASVHSPWRAALLGMIPLSIAARCRAGTGRAVVVVRTGSSSRHGTGLSRPVVAIRTAPSTPGANPTTRSCRARTRTISVHGVSVLVVGGMVRRTARTSHGPGGGGLGVLTTRAVVVWAGTALRSMASLVRRMHGRSTVGVHRRAATGTAVGRGARLDRASGEASAGNNTLTRSVETDAEGLENPQS